MDESIQKRTKPEKVCKTRTFALGDKPHSFFAPEGKPRRRGLNPRPLACGNNLPKDPMDINKITDTLQPEETGVGGLLLPGKDLVVFRPSDRKSLLGKDSRLLD
nr:pre-mRNA-splicing factor ATP-dependent RNA helicase PRP16 [Tanacetum cinerariifolium]